MSDQEKVTFELVEKKELSWKYRFSNREQVMRDLWVRTSNLPSGVESKWNKTDVNLGTDQRVERTLSLKLNEPSAGRYQANIELLDRHGKDPLIPIIRDTIDFEVARKGKLTWKIEDKPSFKDRVAVFKISMNSTLNAPVEVKLDDTSPANPIGFQIKLEPFAIEPNTKKDASLEIEQKSFTLRTSLEVSLDCRAMMVEIPQPGTSTPLKNREPLSLNEISPAFPIKRIIDWPGPPVDFQNLTFDPEKPRLTFNLINKRESSLEVELSGNLGDQPLTHPSITLKPGVSRDIDFSSSVPKLAGTYPLHLSAMAVEEKRTVPKDESLTVPLIGKVGLKITQDPGGTDKEASFKVTMTSSLNAPVRAKLGPDSGEFQFALDRAWIEIGADLLPREASATLRVTQDHFKELTSNVIVPFQFEYVKKDPTAEGGEKRGNLDSEYVSSPSPVPITWEAPWPTVTISDPELDPNPEKPQLKFNLANNLALPQTITLTAKVGDEESQLHPDISLGPNESKPVPMPVSLPKLAGAYSSVVKATADLAAKNKPPVEAPQAIVTVPLSPGFDFKVVPETRSLKEGEDAHFQATITNKSNAKLSFSLMVNAPGKVAAFNGGQSDEYRKAGMVPQQTDQVDIVIRPGPDVKGPFAVKLVGPEYHDKDDRLLPPAQPDESRSLSIEWAPKVPAGPIISSIGDYDLFSFGSALEAYPFVDLASFVSTTEVSILFGAKNENSPSGHIEIRVSSCALNNFDPPNPSKIVEGWFYISIGKIESASGSLESIAVTGCALQKENPRYTAFVVLQSDNGKDALRTFRFDSQQDVWSTFPPPSLGYKAVSKPAIYVQHWNQMSKHIVFIDDQGHLHEHYLPGDTGNEWYNYDLTAMYGLPTAGRASASERLGHPAGYPTPGRASASERLGHPAGYCLEEKKCQVVFFPGGDGYIHAYWKLVSDRDTPWQHLAITNENTITNENNGGRSSLACDGARPSAHYFSEGTNTEGWVVYRGDNDLVQLVVGHGEHTTGGLDSVTWEWVDLYKKGPLELSSAPKAKGNPVLVFNVEPFFFHIIYRGYDDNIYAIVFSEDKQIRSYNLTSESGRPKTVSDPTALLVKGLVQVVYLAERGEINWIWLMKK